MNQNRQLSTKIVRGLLGQVHNTHILCVGDVMLDKSIPCGDGRLSAEAPILVFNEMPATYQIGGAANVAANVASLGAKCSLVGVIGDDVEGEIVEGSAQEWGIFQRLVTSVDGARQLTTRKTRYVSDGRQMMRVDRDGNWHDAPLTTRKVVSQISSILSKVDVILISDYNKGVVNAQTLQACRALASRDNAIILVDPKGRDWRAYGVVDAIKPNAQELAEFTGLPCKTDPEIERAIGWALENSAAHSIVVTRGPRGVSIGNRSGEVTHIAIDPIDVVDVCGAGDSNFAAFGVALASAHSFDEAARFGQIVSRMAVKRAGTAVIGRDDVYDYLFQAEGGVSATRSKVVGQGELAEVVARWRRDGQKIALTNGCFDMLHIGHIETIDFAKHQAGKLIVAINSDSSVKRLKGKARPIIKQRERAIAVAALENVDAVILFDDDTPEALIAAIRPDVLVKGAEYHSKPIVGQNIVEQYGGRIVHAPMVEGFSTSNIIDSIRAGDRAKVSAHG